MNGYIETQEEVNSRWARWKARDAAELERREQERILANITAEAQDAWLDEQRDEREAQATELAEQTKWLTEAHWMQNGGVYMQGEALDGSDTSLKAQLFDAGFGEDGRL